MLIIPAINAQTFEEIQNKIRLIEPYVSWAHLDIADGTFTRNTLWHNPADLALLETNLNLEAHLMVNDVERRIDNWLINGVKRIIFHLGGTNDAEFVVDKYKKFEIEAGISISPDESVAQALAYKNKIDFFQILGVRPGLPGQKMDGNTLERIKEVRKFCQLCIIEVDGGINLETAKKAKEAGANIIVSASAIFNGDKNIKEAIGELKNVIR